MLSTLMLSSAVPLGRRAAMARGVMAGGTAALTPSSAWAIRVYADGSAQRCEAGQGEACAELSEGSPLIKRLQEQSLQNRAKNERELYDQTVRQLQYSEYFSTGNEALVQLPNSSYVRLDMEAYASLRKSGRIQPGAVDRLLPEGVEPVFGPATAEEPPVVSTSLLAYGEFCDALKASRVEGVVFQPPRGDFAYAVVGSASKKVDLGAGWKKAEVVNILTRLDIPNNYAELQQ